MPVTVAQGAIGGWWFQSSIATVFTGLPYLIRVEIADALDTASYGLLAEVRYVPGSSTWSGVWTIIDYDILLRYQTPSGMVELTSHTPVPDPALGKDDANNPRMNWMGPWNYTLVFRGSSFTGGTYQADGYVKLYLNNNPTPILQAVSVVIPRGFGAGYGSQFRYAIQCNVDCDRVWARTTPAILSTDTEGAIVGTPPADLIFFDEFEGGLYPDWVSHAVAPTGPTSQIPNVWPNCGGNDGWGISGYSYPPDRTSSSPGPVVGPPSMYSGLWRVVSPGPIIEPPLPDISGIYFIKPGGTHDSYYNSIERRIPDPIIKTGLFGE